MNVSSNNDLDYFYSTFVPGNGGSKELVRQLLLSTFIFRYKFNVIKEIEGTVQASKCTNSGLSKRLTSFVGDM